MLKILSLTAWRNLKYDWIFQSVKKMRIPNGVAVVRNTTCKIYKTRKVR